MTGVPIATAAPAVLMMDRATLAATRAAARSRSAAIAPAIAALRRDADAALAAEPVAVTGKAVAAPSADPHDYMSLGIYWWPDPAKPSGAPYIQRDGEINAEAADRRRYDGGTLVRMVGSVEILALAGHLTGERSYSDGAARWLRAWFLDARTRMNPSMRYAQIIPGRDELRGTGIIESRSFIRAVDAALLLEGTPSWSTEEQDGLRAWFRRLTDWLTTSEQGRMEGRAANNHATWYDAQVAAFALFGGRDELAAEVLAAAPSRRAATQIAADGRQPLELARTRSYHYSAFNVLALTVLGDLGRHVGVDVWHAAEERIRPAIDVLVPSALGEATWRHPERPEVDHAAELAPVLARAARAYPDAGYERALASFVERLSALARLKLRIGIFGGLGGTASPPPPWAG